MKKLTPLASELRTMAAGDVPKVGLAGTRRHVAAKSQQATPRRSKPLAESGASSLYTSDMVTLLYQSLKLMPDPDEVLRKAGMTRAALRKLSYDDEIAQSLDTRRDAAINTPWRLEGGTEEVNKFITEQIEAFEHLIFPAVWNARPYGYSVTQIVYEDIGGRVGIRWVGEMPFEYYFPQRDGTVLYRAQGNGLPIPVLPQKYLIPVVNPTYLNPYGDAMLSRLYWLWFFRTHGWQYWIQWLEQFGAPFLVGKTKNTKAPGSTSTSVDLLAAALDKTRRGSSIAVDLDSEVEQIESTGTGQQFKYFDDATTRQIAKVILGQTLTSSEGEHGGNRALGQVHNEVRQDKRRADVRVIKLSLQQLVGFLFELNEFTGEEPEFVMEDEKGIESERAKRDATFVEKGVLVFKRPYLEDHYALKADDFIAPGEPGFQEARGTPPQAAIDPATGLPKKKPADNTPPVDKAKKQALLAQLFAKQGVRFTPEQEVIEELVLQMADELPAELLSNAEIINAIREASDPHDLANRLSVVMQDTDVLTFNRVLNFGLGTATVLGFVHAAERPALPAPVKTEAEEAKHFHFHMPGEGPKTMKKNADGTWTITPEPPKEANG